MRQLQALSIILCTVFVGGVQAADKRALPYQHWKTAQQTPVYFIENHQLPIVDAAVVFDAGSARDGKAYGQAALTNALLDAGSKGLDVNEIPKRFEQVGAVFDSSVDRDMASVSLRTLVDKTYRGPAVDTLLSVLKAPLFPEDQIKRVKHQFKTHFDGLQQNPRALASMHFYKALYGDQPYGHWVMGEDATVQKITRSDVQAFFQRYYTAQNAMIVMVGSVSKKQAEKMAEKIAAVLPQGKRAEPLEPMIAYSGGRKWIDYPSKQTSVLWGQQGINRQNPDYFPLMVGNAILGNGMTSRLFKRVRSDEGLVYSISSYFDRMRQPGPFVLSFQTRKLAALKAYDLAKSVTKQFLDEGPTDKELEAAKKNIIGSFALSLAGNDALLRSLTIQAFYHVPADYFETYRNNVAAVTRSQVKAAMRKHFDYSHFISVFVGQPVKVHRHG